MKERSSVDALRLVLAVWLVLAAIPAMVSAQTIYSYTDEHGVTHFTDRKPQTDREVRVQRAVADPQALLDVRQLGPNNDPRWVFGNRTQGPLAVRVSFAAEVNIVSYPELPRIFVLDAAAERELVTIGPLDDHQSWSYRLQTEALPGDPRSSHQPGRPYAVPFAPGEAFHVGQAFGGEFSHSEPASRYAVDISMPIGTPIHAAREGVVMDMARWFHGSGDNRQWHGPRANFVRILHDDGTMAVYAHLDYEGVRVRSGQRVRRGQLIGKSGNTGFSTGPHLHFVIQKNRNMEMVSVPFEFDDAELGSVTPRRGMRLKAR
jgi:murein DD-endopeptidase MepM/ murein hydrolase activator NlpD